jgi:ankyrin repeat protein
MQAKPIEKPNLENLLPDLLRMILKELNVEDPWYFVQLVRVSRKLKATLNAESFKVYWQHRLHHDFPELQGREVSDYKQAYIEAWRSRKKYRARLSERELGLFKKVRRGDLDSIKKGYFSNTLGGKNFYPYTSREFVDVFDVENNNALRVAQSLDRKEIVEYIYQSSVSLGAQANAQKPPLYWAIVCGILTEVNRLKEQADLNQPFPERDLPLYVASTYGHCEIVSALSTDTHVRQSSEALFYATDNGHLGVVRLLIKKGAEVNATMEDFETPIFLAAKKAFHKVVAALVAAGANVNHVNKYGTTPIFEPVTRGYLKVVSTLIAAQANVNHTNIDNSTPILLAAAGGHELVVKALIAAGADVNVAQSNGTTALLTAVAKRHKNVVSELIAAGANINYKEPDGTTALHFAIRNSDQEMTRILVSAGADVNQTSIDGFSPLMIALSWNSIILLDALLSGGGTIDEDKVSGLSITADVSDELQLWRVKIAQKKQPIYEQVIAILGALMDWQAKLKSYFFSSPMSKLIADLKSNPNCQNNIDSLKEFLRINSRWIPQNKYRFITLYILPQDIQSNLDATHELMGEANSKR